MGLKQLSIGIVVFLPLTHPTEVRLFLKPEEKKGWPVNNTCAEAYPIKKSSWRKMLTKVFQADMTQCRHC